MSVRRPRAHRASGQRRPRVALVLIVLGAAVAVGAPTAWWVLRDSPPGPEGQGTAQELASSTPSAPAPASVPASAPEPATQSPSSTVTPPSESLPIQPSPLVPIQSGAPSAEPATAGPARILLPSLGIDARVVPEGVEPTGEMSLPEDVRLVGWYQYSVAPGSPQGSTVLAGHVDDAQQGEGAMFRLRLAEVGSLVSVVDAAGTQLDYRVVAREEFGKDTVPLADLFARGGAHRLTLITCGGQFDSSTRSYESNIVVTALPV